jgi:Mtf2-like protein
VLKLATAAPKDPRQAVDQLPDELRGMAMNFAERLQYKQYMSSMRAHLGSLGQAMDARVETEDVKRLRELRSKEYVRIVEAMDKAKSDVELWNVLQKELFEKGDKLFTNELMAEVTPSKASKKSKKKRGKDKANAEKSEGKIESSQTPPPEGTASEETAAKSREFTDFEVIGPNYSRILVSAVQKLRLNFHGSLFPFVILSEIKRLGPRSYALGTSTKLFNELITLSWFLYGDCYRVIAFLEEMENSSIDFDWETQELLRDIRRAGKRVRGSRKHILREAGHLDYFSEGFKKIATWRDFIKSRLEVETLRQANEQISGLGG